jgi:hypothetical protein
VAGVGDAGGDVGRLEGGGISSFEDGMRWMAEKLGCGFYHGGITDEKQRRHIY